MMRRKLLELIRKNENIPPLPDVLINLERKINDPETDVHDISALIETDPVLSGKLVKLANSVFFSGGRETSGDIQAAILRLGIKMVLELIYAIELPKLFKRPKGFDSIGFWRHSLAVAFLSRTISLRFPGGLSKDEIEMSYLAGLLHDLGILAFVFFIPHLYADFLREIASSTEALDSLERDRFGISHSELGAEFIRHWWPVSDDVVRAVQCHHEPFGKFPGLPGICGVVALANRLAHEVGLDYSIKVRQGEDGESEYMEKLGISQDDLQIIIESTRKAVQDAERLLNE